MESYPTEDNGLAVEIRTVKLPIEIQEHIIDSLDSFVDASTIAQCALVCRTWLPFSRYKLYSSIWLWNNWQWARFKNLVLRSQSPSIAGYLGRMRELHIWPLDVKFPDIDPTQPRVGWGKGQQRPWAHLVLLQCAVRLTGLTRIYMDAVDLSPSHGLAVRSGCYYRSLATLDLVECTFANVLQLHQLVTAFPVLTNLTLTRLKLHSMIVPIPRIYEARHSLTHLELTGEFDVVAVASRWLAKAQLVRGLESLKWLPRTIDNTEEAWRTLTQAIGGPVLQKLICPEPHFWKGLYPHSIWSFMNACLYLLQWTCHISQVSRCSGFFGTPRFLVRTEKN